MSSYGPGFCVCGEPSGPHDCKGDENSPAVQLLIGELFAVHACARCGIGDETVARGGTALCGACAELSALTTPAREAAHRKRRRELRFILAACFVFLVFVPFLVFLLT